MLKQLDAEDLDRYNQGKSDDQLPEDVIDDAS